MTHYISFETAEGHCAIAWKGQAVVSFLLPTRSMDDIARWQQRRIPDATPGQPSEEIAEIIARAIRYFDGQYIDFSNVLVDLEGQSPFFTQIYTALRRVPYGEVTTYGTLAKELGAGPEMARDVGIAMGSNPVPLIIPCHRVLAAGGKTGGFSAPGGVRSKIRMLELEGVQVEESPAQKKPAPSPQGTFDF